MSSACASPHALRISSADGSGCTSAMAAASAAMRSLACLGLGLGLGLGIGLAKPNPNPNPNPNRVALPAQRRDQLRAEAAGRGAAVLRVEARAPQLYDRAARGRPSRRPRLRRVLLVVGEVAAVADEVRRVEGRVILGRLGRTWLGVGLGSGLGLGFR